MSKSAQYVVEIDGSDISQKVEPYLQSISVQDRAGTSTDSAAILLNDSSGELTFPKHNAKMRISLGFRGEGIGLVFAGTVDEVKSFGSRQGGKTIEVLAKGLDTSGKMKEPQQRHFDDKTVQVILEEACAFASVTDVRVDPDICDIVRDYEHMDDESALAFGQRLAKELGCTFKVRNDAAIMVLKNAVREPGGVELPPVTVEFGKHIHSWRISPYIGRPRYSQVRVRYYDRARAVHDEIILDTEVEGSDAVDIGRFEAVDKKHAEQKAASIKADCQRNSGVGHLVIEGNAFAQPEAVCNVVGLRDGVSGRYVIDGVNHKYSRGSGFVTRLDLAYPT